VLGDILQDTVDEKYFYTCGYDFHGEEKTVAATLHINGHDILKRVNSRKHKCQTLTTCGGGNTQKKVYVDGRCRKLTPVEYERLQTLPDGYTEGVSDTARWTAIGNGWTVDVIAHLLTSIKEIER
jgi:DNA (cytosine-5)-methyltransferase 3A